MSNRPIIVGIDDSAGSTAALFWAADEARLRGRSLLVVHSPAAVRGDLVAEGGAPGLRAVDNFADYLLGSHATAASARQPRVPVTTLLGHGEPGDTLIDLSVGAAMVVLGLHAPRALRIGVARRVAAQAHSAVVMIPDGAAFSAADGRVAFLPMGSSADAHTRAVAVEEAALRGVRLRALGTDGATRVCEAMLAEIRHACLVVVPSARMPGQGDSFGPVVAELLASVACPVMAVGPPSATTRSPAPVWREPGLAGFLS